MYKCNYITLSITGWIRVFLGNFWNFLKQVGKPDTFLIIFSPDGHILASGSGSPFANDNTIRLWNPNTGTHLKTLIGHTKAVNSVVFSPDGLRLASGSLDGALHLWDVATGEALSILTADGNSLCFSPDGSMLATSNVDGTVHLWNISQLTPLPLQEESMSAEDYFMRAGKKGEEGDFKGAVNDLNKAIHLKPDFASAYFVRGNAKDRLDQHSAAIEDFDMTLHLKPDFAGAYLCRGISKGQLGQHTAAIADFDIFILLEPDSARAYYNRGLAKYLLGNTQEARQDLQKALKNVEQTGDTKLKSSIEKKLQDLE